MSQSRSPDRDPTVEKAAVVRSLESLLGATTQAVKRRPDWRVSANGMTSVFITFSQDDDLFYDVSEADARAWATYPRAFVIFVMGTAEEVLVLPLAVLQDKILAE